MLKISRDVMVIIAITRDGRAYSVSYWPEVHGYWPEKVWGYWPETKSRANIPKLSRANIHETRAKIADAISPSDLVLLSLLPHDEANMIFA